MPLPLLLRSIAINTVSSSPLLLSPSLKIMSLLAHSSSALLNPDTNPLLRLVLKHTFYSHFCAGEVPTEVKRTIASLKGMGYKGVILCYAREVVLDAQAAKALEASGGKASEDVIQREILPWKTGTLETVRLTERGDMVALKFTGAGSQALYALSHNLPPPPALEDAIREICELARDRGVRLVFDAEQAALQKGIDNWTLDCMKRYNAESAVVYCTYQAYLKGCPAVLAEHLAEARKGGFVAGVKLVRGAYINSDPRHLINDTKADTDAMYDGLAEAVLKREYRGILKAADGEAGEKVPRVSLVLACHNLDSVRKAMAIRRGQAERGEELIEMDYGQLQGMADEVSCELLQRAEEAKIELATAQELQASTNLSGNEKTDMMLKAKTVDIPRAYKYLVWGTTGECMKYLLRRAQENKDAVQRTRAGRDEMAKEALRRMKGFFGFSA